MNTICKYFRETVEPDVNSFGDSRSMAQAYNLSLLINKILANYDIKTRPNAGGPPVVVSVEFKVISFGEIREVNMVSPFSKWISFLKVEN